MRMVSRQPPSLRCLSTVRLNSGRPSEGRCCSSLLDNWRTAGDAIIVISFPWDLVLAESFPCATHALVLVILILVVVHGAVWAARAGADPGPKVTSIEIRGNKQIELPAIQGRLTLKPGDPYTPENVRGQIKILYETGFFEDVQVETEATPDGIAVAFVVREKPFITEIVFDGNENSATTS